MQLYLQLKLPFKRNQKNCLKQMKNNEHSRTLKNRNNLTKPVEMISILRPNTP